MAMGADARLLEALARVFHRQRFRRADRRDRAAARAVCAARCPTAEIWALVRAAAGLSAERRSGGAGLRAAATARCSARSAAGAAAAGQRTMRRLAAKLAAIDPDALGRGDLADARERVSLTGSGGKAAASPPRSGRSRPRRPAKGAWRHADARSGRADGAGRGGARTALGARRRAKRPLALHRFAARLPAELRGAQTGARLARFRRSDPAGAARLLNDPGVAAWVLYRLDGGIDHILVDEAQDTSPAQWRGDRAPGARNSPRARARGRTRRARCSWSATRNSRSIRSRAPIRANSTGCRTHFAAPFGAGRRHAAATCELEYSFRSSRRDPAAGRSDA